VLEQLLAAAAAAAKDTPSPPPPYQSTFTLGEKQDWAVVIESGVVTITSTSEPTKCVTMQTNRWAHFIANYKQVDTGERTRPQNATGGFPCAHR